MASSGLVGHFFHIDLNVLQKELGDCRHELDNPAVCTARVHHWIQQQGRCREDFEEEFERVDLETLAKAYDLEFREAHHALEEAFFTARLWQEQIVKLQSLGGVKSGRITADRENVMPSTCCFATDERLLALTIPVPDINDPSLHGYDCSGAGMLL